MDDFYSIKKTTLDSLCNAIRAKTGGAELLDLEVAAPDAIRSLSESPATIRVTIKNTRTDGVSSTIEVNYRGTTKSISGSPSAPSSAKQTTISMRSGDYFVITGTSSAKYLNTTSSYSGVELRNSTDKSFFVFRVTATSGTASVSMKKG